MRGEILRYDDNSGEGLISGDDGNRYMFSRSDLEQLQPLATGARVDFQPVDGRATEVILLNSATATVPTAMYTGENLGLWGYFAAAFKKYVTFDGRARRKEYWSFTLFYTIFMVGLFWSLVLLQGRQWRMSMQSRRRRHQYLLDF